MTSRLQRKLRRRALRVAARETRATRSEYAAKAWEREHGRPPRPDAYSRARAKEAET